MKRSNAFTLVELLVVIGIIALLISILLPALGKARHQAQITQCAAKMRDMGNAVHMYANDNRDALPPARWDNGAANYSLWGNNGSNVAYLWTYRNSSAFNSATEDGNGLGRLVKTGYLKDNSDTFLVDKLLSCTNTKFDSGVSTWQSLYYFNPHLQIKIVGGTWAYQLWFKKLSKFGKLPNGAVDAAVQYSPWRATVALPNYRRALMTDPMYDFASSTHARGDRRTWNLLYADGSVQSVYTEKKAQRSLGHGKWQTLLDQTGYLQDLADDGNADHTAGGMPNWNKGLYNAMPIDLR